MNKTVSVVTLSLLWVLAAGCQGQATKARVRVRVFEVPTQALRLHVSNQNPRKLSDSAYSVSIVSPDDLNAMLGSYSPRPWVLADRTRVINDWPSITDSWIYAPERAAIQSGARYNGGGVGALGVRARGGRLDVHLDYLVSHRGAQGQKLIDSKLFYEHDYREGEVLLFHTPLSDSGQGPRHHVIAFEITREGAQPGFGVPASRQQPPDVLAFR